MGFFNIEKKLNLNNICKGFKKTRIWPLNPNVMVNKMQPSEAFLKMETPHLNFDQGELHIKRFWVSQLWSLKLSTIIMLKSTIRIVKHLAKVPF